MKILGSLRLESERLVLRKVELKDTVSLFRNWASDPNANKYLSFDTYQSEEDLSVYIKSIIKKYNEDNALYWVIEIKESHECIGMVHAEQKKSHVGVKIGYSIGSKYWGCGYATESIKRLIKFLIKDCRVHVITADFSSAHEQGCRVYEKAGMKKEAVLKDRRVDPDTLEYCDLNIYSILEGDYYG